MIDIARQKNSTPLPLIPEKFGPRLPPERYCLTANNYRIKDRKKPVRPHYVHIYTLYTMCITYMLCIIHKSSFTVCGVIFLHVVSDVILTVSNAHTHSHIARSIQATSHPLRYIPSPTDQADHHDGLNSHGLTEVSTEQSSTAGSQCPLSLPRCIHSTSTGNHTTRPHRITNSGPS